MKLTIFAATGGTGRQVLEQAVAASNEVTALECADAAHFMLAALERPETIRQSIAVAY
jgi:putative NADH-flavin reductase